MVITSIDHIAHSEVGLDTTWRILEEIGRSHIHSIQVDVIVRIHRMNVRPDPIPLAWVELCNGKGPSVRALPRLQICEVIDH